jgi:hypothetical protein
MAHCLIMYRCFGVMCAVTSSITMNAVEVSVEVVNSGVTIVHGLGFESLSFRAHQ